MRSLPTTAVLALLVACSAEQSPTAKPGGAPAERALDADLVSLVPPNTAAFVYAPNLGQLVDRVRALVASVEPGREGMVDLSLLEPMLPGLRVKDLDTDKPAAIAVWLEGDAPVPVLILPCVDPAGAQDIVDVTAAAAGSWLALSPQGPTQVRAAAPAIVDGVPAGDLAVRVDLSRFESMLTDAERMVVSEMREAGPMGEQVAGVYDWLFDVLRDARYLDMSTAIDGGEVAMTFAIEPTGEGTPIPKRGDLADVLRRVPREAGSMVVAMNGDLSSMYDWFMPMVEGLTAAMPEESQGEFRSMFEAQRELYAAIAGPAAGRFGFGENGMHGVFVSKPADVGALMEQIEAFGASSAGVYGVESADVSETEAGGVTFTTVRLDSEALMDVATYGNEEMRDQTAGIMTAMYGDEVVFHVAAVDATYVVTAVGRDHAGLEAVVETLRTGDATDQKVLAEIAALSGDPYVFMTMDAAELLRPMAEMFAGAGAGGMPPIPADASAPIWFALTERGGRHAAEFGFDVAAFAAMFR